MDPATVIALCKENIQPLRYGRNAAQLGTALRAQEDVDVQQLLLQEKQMYEDAIKNYEGDDPLENWYDYILWMEQSYPKSGHESHIGKLLQQCLATFEKETKYYQDQRYIRLWINYISMQKNPLELYQLLYNNGIGTMVADMYRAWAFELEQIEDYKQADEVYMMGLRARAEPLDELDYAHKNFQLAVARKTLGRMEDRCEVSVFEQRQAFSSLKAIKAGKKVSSIRTGHRVREYYPGSIPQVTSGMQSARSSSRVQIYQDDVPGEMKGASILDHVPVEDMMHKENTIKPGPWNNGNKRCTLLTSNVKTAFKVHEDQADDNDLQKIRLFPNHTPFFDGSKYPEHMMVPVYVPDRPNPNVILKPHYPKDIVYANNMDLSMEEIRAQRYLLKSIFNRHSQDIQKKYSDSNIDDKCSRNVDLQSQQKGIEPQNHSITLQELQHQRQEYAQQKMVQRHQNLEFHRREVEHLEMERHRIQIEQQELHRQRYEIDNQVLENQRHEANQQELKRLEVERLEAERIEAERMEAKRIEAQRIEAERLEARRIEAERLEAQRIEAARLEAQRIEAERLEAQRIEAERLEAQRIEAERIEAERIEAERIEAERIEAERIEAQRMEAELNTQRKLQSSYLHPHHASSLSADNEEHLLGQSLTVNTKEAISVVQDLWHSPSATPITPRFRNPIAPRMTDSRTKLSFDIHMDSSMTQHAMSSKHHQGYSVQPYNDQENHQTYHSPHQNYATPTQHTPYGNHGIPNTYHYQMQHHDQQVQQLSHHSHHQLMQSHQQTHSLHHQSIASSQHLQSHTQLQHHHPHVHHHSPHNQHLQHQQHQQHHTHHHMHQMQHPAFGNMLPNDIGYQQYPSSLEPTLLQQNSEPQKSLHYPPYSESNIEANKPYRMPPELPYIKSPGMNRRDLKYLENAENKENAIVVDYNGPLEENMPPKSSEENNLYTDDTLGIAPLSGPNDTCYTEACNALLSSSTPMTNQFRQLNKPKDVPPYPNQNIQHHIMPDIHNGNADEKLSVIMESTREYVSSSSASSGHTRTVASGFTSTREEMSLIKESELEGATNDSIIASSQPYEQKMRAQIQAVHAQSPRTVQRNVDQITSEIKNNCDLRKSINFKLSNETDNQEKADTMDCEEHEPMEQVEEETFQLPSGDINPFDKNLIAGLLKKIKFPQPHHAEGYVRINTNLNKFVPSTMITLGSEAYNLEKCLGKGMYGTVFKAISMQTGQTVALKTQKPAWVWEYYIVREIKARLTNPHMLRGFMDVSIAYVANNSSVLVSEFSKFGTLLAVTNTVKMSTGKPLIEALAIFFTIEMLQIVEHLHKCQIIHGDIKPDNFLLMRLPTEDVRPTIQLIDFGCSIDMSLLPEKTTFTHVIKTEEFTCIEMQTGRPWTYQTDLYCLAATSHCLLFGNYMRVSNVGDHWFINSKLPRYAKKAAWEPFFTELLNIESCEKLPDLCRLRNIMEEALPPVPELQSKFRILSNILNKR